MLRTHESSFNQPAVDHDRYPLMPSRLLRLAAFVLLCLLFALSTGCDRGSRRAQRGFTPTEVDSLRALATRLRTRIRCRRNTLEAALERFGHLAHPVTAESSLVLVE